MCIASVYCFCVYSTANETIKNYKFKLNFIQMQTMYNMDKENKKYLS